MVAPSLRALGAVTAASTGSPTFAAPAGAQASDLIVCAWFQDDGRTSVSGVLPPGFFIATDTPQVNNPLAGSPSHRLNVYQGVFSAVGPGPYTFTVVPGIGTPTPFCEGRTGAIQDAGTPWSGTPDGATSGDTNVSTAPLVTSSSLVNDCYALYISTNWNGGAWTPPVGYTERWDANDRIITFADLTMPLPAITSPQAVNVSSSRMNAWVGIIPPVFVPPPPTPADVEWCAQTPVTGWTAEEVTTGWFASEPDTNWRPLTPEEDC
jgi:hypothetical protein